MKCRGRWAVVGLLCVCSVMGCTALPARGLFARRPRPTTTADDAVTDKRDHATRDDELLALADGLESFSRDARSVDSTGGLFDVSSRGKSVERSSVVEAPSPKRRSAKSTRNANPGGDVIMADYAENATGGHAPIDLAAGQRRAGHNSSGAVNPWERFRSLSNNAEPNEDYPQDSFDTEQLRSTNPSTVPQGSTLPLAFAPATESETDIAPNNNNSPQLWPQAPGAVGSDSAAAPQDIQWVNSEQPALNNGVNPGFPFPTPPNSPVFAPTANGPQNFGVPEGAPPLIAPFATSADLERLIAQTTIEAAALIPGDNEIARQLYLRKQVQLRLLHLIAGQTDRALQPVPGVDPADQEFWQQMLWGMANYFDTQGMPDSSERATQTIAQLKSAASRLQEKARLELRNVAFCLKISGYGNYQRFKRDEFMPGQPVLLYAEVGNFKSELLADGQFRTLLKSALEIVEGGPAGRVVETLPLAPSEDRCRNQRRDYYHSYEFAIPQGCNPGPHTLRLRVEDQLGKKFAVTALNFTVQ